MLILGEIVAQRSTMPFADFLATEVLEPLGLGSRLGAPATAADLVDVPFLGTRATSVRFNAGAGFPSNCVTGPFADAATLCELLREGGVDRGRPIPRAETAAAVTSLQHSAPMDRRLAMPVTLGLGVEIDAFPFGRHCSPRTFGHGGARSSAAFADPDADISVAIFFNGNCPLREHVRRINAASTAVYLDLGLVKPSDLGRDHQAPLGTVV